MNVAGGITNHILVAANTYIMLFYHCQYFLFKIVLDHFSPHLQPPLHSTNLSHLWPFSKTYIGSAGITIKPNKAIFLTV